MTTSNTRKEGEKCECRGTVRTDIDDHRPNCPLFTPPPQEQGSADWESQFDTFCQNNLVLTQPGKEIDAYESLKSFISSLLDQKEREKDKQLTERINYYNRVLAQTQAEVIREVFRIAEEYKVPKEATRINKTNADYIYLYDLKNQLKQKYDPVRQDSRSV